MAYHKQQKLWMWLCNGKGPRMNDSIVSQKRHLQQLVYSHLMWLHSPILEWLDSTTTSQQWGPSEGSWASPESWGQTRPSGQGEDRMGQCIECMQLRIGRWYSSILWNQKQCSPPHFHMKPLFSQLCTGWHKEKERSSKYAWNHDENWCNVLPRLLTIVLKPFICSICLNRFE